MLSQKNSTLNNLQAILEQTTRIVIKTREVEIVIEVDRTTEEINMEEKVTEVMEITIEELVVADKTIEKNMLDKIQVVIRINTTTTIITTTIDTDKMNQVMEQH